ncbi:MAG: hypothetical protein LBC85_02360 [Fibromonadaceae bacterium]|nr:hypothetical protein [Fibromonadaceae bacterium]
MQHSIISKSLVILIILLSKVQASSIVVDEALEVSSSSEEINLYHIEANLYSIDPVRLAIISGSIAASYAAIYYALLKEGWWPGGEHARPFNFQGFHNDMHYASNLDKFGHFYAGAIFGEIFTMSYDWVGMSPFASTLWAGITLGVTQILVEFKDGFSPYGYSIYDAMAGCLGGFYAMGKRFIPAMQYVDYKWAYWPNSSVYWDEVRADNDNGIFVDDYPNQTHWLSFKVGQMLPSNAKWLAFAFGWGIDETRYEERWDGYIYEFYLGLDYDLHEIFKPKKTWSKNLVTILNFAKLPAPTVRLGKRLEFFPFYPLHFHGFVTF